MITAKEDGFEL